METANVIVFPRSGKNEKQAQVNAIDALKTLANELEAEAIYIERHGGKAMSPSVENIRYAAKFIRDRFCGAAGLVVLSDVKIVALREL